MARCEHPSGLMYCKIHDVVHCASCGAEYSSPMFRYEMDTPAGRYQFVIPTGHADIPSFGRRAPSHASHA